jgi:centromeric protein E
MNEMREQLESLQQQLQMSMLEGNVGRHKQVNSLVNNPEEMGGWLNCGSLSGELRYVEQNGSESDNRNSHATSKDIDDSDALLQSQILMQVWP